MGTRRPPQAHALPNALRRRAECCLRPSISAEKPDGKNKGKLRLSEALAGWKPQKPSLFCMSTRGNPQKSSLREVLHLC
jgi:hypothetical protein